MRWGLVLFLVACSSDAPSNLEPGGRSDAGSTASTADLDSAATGPSSTIPAEGNADTEPGSPSSRGTDAGKREDEDEDPDDPVDPDGALGPEVLVAPSIVGDAIEGESLTASFGEYSRGATVVGVWQRCTNGSCQTAASAEDRADYTLRAADVGHRMRLEVTATDEEGVTHAVSPPTAVVVEAGAVVNKEPPVLGDAFVFRAVELTAGTWLSRTELARSYQWQRCVDAHCEDIAGATGTSYTPAPADLGARLKVVETVATDDESFSATSNETDEVTCADPVASEALGATSAVNVASGVDWTFTAGGLPAVAQAIGPSKRSALLVSHGFGYSLGESHVQGIEVRITRRASSALAIRNQRVALYAPAARTKLPDSEHWSTDRVTAVYGGPADTWGEAISTDVVNSSQLRLALAVENTGEEPADATIENVEVVVYHTSFTSTVFHATTVSEGGDGSAWVTPAAAVNEDGAAATLSIPAGATPVTSKVLTLGGFGATLPTDAVPSGYALEVLQTASPGLVLNSTLKVGTVTEMKNQLPFTLGYVTYGGAGETWGLTKEDVTSAEFNAQLQVVGQGLSGSGSVQVDAVRLRVYLGSEEAEEQRAASVLETTSNEFGWSNVDNVLADDGAVTTTTLLSDQRSSGSLVLSGFAASVPDDAAISGITLAVKRSATATEQLRDLAVFLRAGSTSIGANRSSPALWPTTTETRNYGGPNDRWRSSLNASDVNSGSLGAELTVAHVGNAGAAAPEIDSVRLTVHYCTD